MKNKKPMMAFLCLFLFLIMRAAMAEETILLAETEENEIEVCFPSSVDESYLDSGYIASVMPGGTAPRMRASRPAGLSLSGAEQNLYRLLAAGISRVAAGEEGSTEFAFLPTEIYEKTSYSAEDLGVDWIRNGNEYNPEAVQALKVIRDRLDVALVINCLMNDFPLQMYWFGKAYTPIKCSISGTAEALNLSGSVIIRMRVAEDYAARSIGEDGTINYHAYEADTSFGLAVQIAADNAAAILARYEGQTDYELLTAYRDEICALTSYNTEAGNGQYQFNYGNPWQLVWVFDGDPETNVVCEGYAKAFQYLCEAGTESAVVISVQGYLNRIAQDRAHMWNIVTINGHNYLADLTSYDVGNDVFLTGYTDGDIENGYATATGQRYYYHRGYTQRTDAELTLEPFSYEEWRAAVTTAPTVTVSSGKTYPGKRVAVRIESKIPFQQILIGSGGETAAAELEDNMALISVGEDTEITFAGIADGIRTPAAEPVEITVAEMPETMITLPAGSRIESGAFAGTAAECIVIQDNKIEAGAFDGGVLLIVDEAREWFESGYRFVVK